MQENNIFNRIYEQEATPPPGMWNRIALQLDAQDEATHAPIISMQDVPKKTSWLKIALAACSIGFVTMTTLWFVAQNKNTKTVAQNTTNTPNNNTITKTITDTVYIPTTNEVLTTNGGLAYVDNNNVPSNNNNNKYITTPKTNTTIKNNTANNTNISNPTKVNNNNTATNNTEITTANNNQVINTDNTGTPPQNIVDVNITNPASLSGPISQGDKAISSILNKLSMLEDNEELDSIINKSAIWKKQIAEWRNNLIKSGYAPSLINHMDIISLLKLLDEKKK